MKPDLQRRIQRYGWDKAAPYYDNSWQTQLWAAQKKLLSKAELGAGDSVLDVSCGSGLVTHPIAKKIAPGGTVIGIDLSEGMIEKARRRAENKEIENTTFKRMDAEQLDFQDDTFDKVICSLGLMYFPNPHKALAEMYRVAAPKADVLALVWGERKGCGWASIFPIVDRRVKSEVCPLFFQLGTGKALQAAFESAGFKEVSTERFSYDLHFEDDEDACKAAFWGGAVALAYQKFDETTRIEAHREYLDSIQPFKNGNGYYIPGEFVIVSAKKN